jgi:hypothetical protein
MRSRRMLSSVLIRRSLDPTTTSKNSQKEGHYAMCQDFGLRHRFLFGGAH